MDLLFQQAGGTAFLPATADGRRSTFRLRGEVDCGSIAQVRASGRFHRWFDGHAFDREAVCRFDRGCACVVPTSERQFAFRPAAVGEKGQTIDLVVYETILKNDTRWIQPPSMCLPVLRMSKHTSPKYITSLRQSNCDGACHAIRLARTRCSTSAPDAFDEAGLSRAVFGLSAQA